MAKKSNPLMNKLKKMKTHLSAESKVMSESRFFIEGRRTKIGIPLINIAFSGDIDKGMPDGSITMIGAPSKHFKSSIALKILADWQKEHPQGVCVFYDNEFGTRENMFKSYGVDPDLILHQPFDTVENLKIDHHQKMAEFDRDDDVLFLVDSLGMASSKKELEDADKGDSKADMTRAKAIKSYFRMITPVTRMKDFTFICINHTYQTIEKYAKTVLGGGTGGEYAPDNTIFISRSQEKEGKELTGYTFNLRLYKSRDCVENSVLPLTVHFDGGIRKYSGMKDLAKEFELITNCRMANDKRLHGYQLNDEHGEIVENEDGTPVQIIGKLVDVDDDFWETVFEKTNFKERVRNKYILVNEAKEYDEEIEAKLNNSEED
jgi:RecA/RadA recombinase